VFAAHPRLWLVADTQDMLRAPVENLIARTVTHDVMKVSPEVGGLGLFCGVSLDACCLQACIALSLCPLVP